MPRLIWVAGAFSALFPALAAAQTLRFDELHRMLPWDHQFSRALDLGDVDGDRDLDLLVADGGGQGLVGTNDLYQNDGDGRFVETLTRFPSLADQTEDLSFGDLDGDGDLDAVIANTQSTQNRIYLNDGYGNFSDATAQLPPDMDFTNSLALGDVDGDGDLDIVFGNYLQNRLYRNDGNGVFTDATSNIPADTDMTRAVAFHDVDQDQDLDVLLGNSGQNRLYRNDGSGSFVDSPSSVPTDSLGTFSIAFGDVDGDDNPDALIGNAQGSGLGAPNRLYHNDGFGNFEDVEIVSHVPPSDTRAVALEDVDRDGDLDAVIGNTSRQNRLYRNDGTGVFSDATASLLPVDDDATFGIALRDVDGDLDPDFLAANSNPKQTNRLYLNRGSGAYTDVTSQTPLDDELAVALALGDVDSDQDVDCFLANGGSFESNRLYRNDGTGVLSDSSFSIPPDDGDDVVLGDLDGDQDLDGMLARANLTDLVYVNDGTGTFVTDPSLLPPLQLVTTSIELGDTDGDADLDALMVTGAFGLPQQDRLYQNDGGGAFADISSAALPHDIAVTLGASFTDVEQDGDLDLLLARGWLSLQDRLLLNDGMGIFTDATSQLPDDPKVTGSIISGDVDGDDDLDLFLRRGASNCLYLNDGFGTFHDASGQLTQGSSYDAAFGDVDGDVDLDLVLADGVVFSGAQNRISQNDGTGRFDDLEMAFPNALDFSYAVGLADTDGDADLDALFANNGQNRFLTNLSRQLAWRATPRIGRSLTLDVYGMPGERWLLLSSLGTSEIILAFGVFRLDPSLLFTVGAGFLDDQGRASVSVAVPANPSLIGLSLYWQAVLASQLALTNLEVTRFVDL